MTTVSGTPPDPGEHAPTVIDGDTSQIQLPIVSKAGLYCTTSNPPSGMSGLLATIMCIATVILTATVALAAIEETRNAPVVTPTTMLLLATGAATSWIAVFIVIVRDRMHRDHQALLSGGERILARNQELSVRQDALSHHQIDLANRQAEQMQLMRQIAANVAAVRREMADVIGVADADAELQLRQAVNDNHRLPGGGLYVVPPEN
ncbi:hypothetical protein OOK41_09290 [Micromonospora sp. NBC_01655]|uniref:hypothetical protein n=1 Tax=Micromonospora sp. NBC_01655 TaxID=2975983 RepID=UPI00225061A3|nr:hypothetical protein [Micromonospora sp. NBC_01655]MCX4470500.1 hypothetical protein [Micromonospora sp. NBC_01655]